MRPSGTFCCGAAKCHPQDSASSHSSATPDRAQGLPGLHRWRWCCRQESWTRTVAAGQMGVGLASQQQVEGTIGASCLLLPLPSLHPGFYRGDGVPQDPTLPQPLGLTLHKQHALRCAPDTRA